MPSSAIIDLAIGLIFVFGVTAALASVFTEVVSRFIGLRGAYLLTGLRELVDSSKATTDLGKAQEDYRAMRDLMQNGTVAQAAQPAPSVTGALLGGPILSSQGMVGQIQARNLTIEPEKRGSLHKMTADRQTGDRQTADQQTADQQKPTADQQKGGVWRQRRSLPAYFSGDSFAEAVIDLVAPDAAGETTMDTIQGNVRKLPDPFKSSLLALVKNADNDVSRFRTSVEHWYDDHMSRVSGWYKRHVAIITLAVGAILIVLLNINVLTIGRTLYSQTAVNTAVSAVAAKGDRVGHRPRLPGAGSTLQLDGPARTLQPARRLVLAVRAGAHRLFPHDHRDCAWCPVLVRPAQQDRRHTIDRPETRRNRELAGRLT